MTTPSAVAALAPAKINLFLHVGAPEASGYHPICSLMVFADIGDGLTAVAADHLSLRIEGPFADGLSADSDNLVTRAAAALLAQAGDERGVALSLDKRLPVAAGLGGGSSDAGAALRLVRDMMGLSVDDAALEAIAASLGADGAACFRAQPVLAQGRGERLSGVTGLPPLHAVLVNPGVPVSTPSVYGQFDARGVFGEVEPPPIPTLEDGVQAAAWLATLRNDLETAAIDVAPQVGGVLQALRAEPETLLARVSGSGGSCFALCAEAGSADRLASRVASARPGWWVKACRLG